MFKIDWERYFKNTLDLSAFEVKKLLLIESDLKRLELALKIYTTKKGSKNGK